MEMIKIDRKGFCLKVSCAYGKTDQNQRVKKIVQILFVISGSAVQIRPWAPILSIA